MLILYINQADMQFDPALPPSPPLPLSLLRRETFLRALIVSVWLNCRRRIGHGTQRRRSRDRQAAGWMESGRLGHGQQAAVAEEGGKEGRRGLSPSLPPSLAHSLTRRSLHQFLST